MLFEKTRTPQVYDPPSVRARPVDDLRKDIGFLGTIKVNGAERRAKVDAAKQLVHRTVAVAADIAETALEADATIIKGAITARMVPVMGGILDEVVLRTGHVRLGLRATEHSGVVAQIKSRHQAQSEFQHLFDAGQMSEAELAEANAFTAQRTTDNCVRLVRDIDRAHDGLDASLARVVNHVQGINKEDK